MYTYCHTLSLHDALPISAVLRDLVDVRSALLAAGESLPTFLLAGIDRAAPFLRMLRHNDGGLGLFNGSGEGEGWLVDMLLAQADARGRAPTSAPQSGFDRIVSTRTTVLMDTGTPPQAALDIHPQAGTLPPPLSAGKERSIPHSSSPP